MSSVEFFSYDAFGNITQVKTQIIANDSEVTDRKVTTEYSADKYLPVTIKKPTNNIDRHFIKSQNLHKIDILVLKLIKIVCILVIKITKSSVLWKKIKNWAYLLHSSTSMKSNWDRVVLLELLIFFNKYKEHTFKEDLNRVKIVIFRHEYILIY